VLLAQRRLREARETIEQGITTVQALLAQDSNSVPLRRMLAGLYRPLGGVYLAESKADEALKIYEKALALDLAVLTLDPDAADSQRLVALSQLRIAEALATGGRRTEAVEAYQEAARVLGALSAREPAKARLARDVALGRMKLGALIDADGDRRGLAELERAVATFRELARSDPRDAGAQRDLMVALVALGDAVAKTDPGRARPGYIEARRLAEMLNAEPFDDPQAERDLRIVADRLTSASMAPAADPELKLSVTRNGADVPFDKFAVAPALGADMRVSWRAMDGRAQYVLVLGGEGRASLLSRDELAAAGWRLKANGPPPSQTLLLITTPRALAQSERASLVEALSKVPGPRQVPMDSHILWRSNQPETLDSTATARGGFDLQWTKLVRAELERLSGLRFSGRTFPLATR
jgi:tetratricopeptide (TPR) repeat protein